MSATTWVFGTGVRFVRMVSIHTNKAALAALRAADAAGRELAEAQRRVATGLKVAGPKDNAAIYAIAQTMRAEIGGWQAVGQSLARGLSALEVAAAGAATINDLLVELDSRAAALQDAALDGPSRAALQQEMRSLIAQVDQQAKLAAFDNLNLIANPGVPKVLGRTRVQTYRPDATPLTPQSFLTSMQRLPAAASVSRTLRTTTSYAVPASPLTPESFATLPRATASRTSVMSNIALVSGDYALGPVPPESLAPAHRPPAALRYDLLLDTFAGADAVEVWSEGVRVAATGQAYVPGGGGVGPAALVSGEHRLSFDYDPSRSYEVRTVGGAGGWGRYAGSGYGLASAPLPSPPGVHETTVVATLGAPPHAGTPLNLETSGSPPGGGTATYVLDGGAASGRVDMVFDASLTGDTVEIWQDGQRVAASGRAYVPGGAPVGPAAAVSGQQVISFDYDASKPHALEFRFAGGAWAVGGLALQPNGAPLPVLSPATTEAGVQVTTAQDTRDLPEPFDPLTPETGAPLIGETVYAIDAGIYAGRVDLTFDAFDTGDVIEVWQGGVRLAATGQPYAPGGGGVGVGSPVSGQGALSFDYDPANGQMLEFRINADPGAGDSAWVVTGLTLQDPSAPAPSAASTGDATYPLMGVRYPDYAFIHAPDGSSMKVESRDLTAAGLGLASLDWTDPDGVREAVREALALAVEAAQHLGVQQAGVERLIRQTTELRDVLAAGVGNLVDADLGRESARLEAAKAKQQLSVETLGLANAQPRWILQLFRGG